jgi:hypothetical protein
MFVHCLYTLRGRRGRRRGGRREEGEIGLNADQQTSRVGADIETRTVGAPALPRLAVDRRFVDRRKSVENTKMVRRMGKRRGTNCCGIKISQISRGGRLSRKERRRRRTNLLLPFLW